MYIPSPHTGILNKILKSAELLFTICKSETTEPLINSVSEKDWIIIVEYYAYVRCNNILCSKLKLVTGFSFFIWVLVSIHIFSKYVLRFIYLICIIPPRFQQPKLLRKFLIHYHSPTLHTFYNHTLNTLHSHLLVSNPTLK